MGTAAFVLGLIGAVLGTVGAVLGLVATSIALFDRKVRLSVELEWPGDLDLRWPLVVSNHGGMVVHIRRAYIEDSEGRTVAGRSDAAPQDAAVIPLPPGQELHFYFDYEQAQRDGSFGRSVVRGWVETTALERPWWLFRRPLVKSGRGWKVAPRRRRRYAVDFDEWASECAFPAAV